MMWARVTPSGINAASVGSPLATGVSIRMIEPPERNKCGALRRKRRKVVVRKSASPRRFDLLTRPIGPWDRSATHCEH